MTGSPAFAQKRATFCRDSLQKMMHQPIDQRTAGLKGLAAVSLDGKATGMKKAKADEELEFIFDPEGEEKIYVMSLYSYDQTNSSFQHAQSLKSQVRFADDTTVYFKDITCSLNVKTWLKGRIDNDTIRIPFGQSLAYYRGQYEVFFAPMSFDDSTGVLLPQEEFKLVIKGDSLVAPMLGEDLYQAAAGYVYINDDTQGALSLDVDHGMRALNASFVEAPADIEPEEYIYNYTTSRGNLFKRKVNVKKSGNELYLQLSTCATEAYVKATIEGNTGKNVKVESGQPITDSTFVYLYSLADPVYNPETGELSDFTPATEGCRLYWDEENHTLSSDSMLLGVDYLDGMQMCMDFIFHPTMVPYAGDVLAEPIAPFLSQVSIAEDMMFKYICFYQPALDVDSNYINVDKLTYSIYINDTLLTFTPEEYQSLSEPTTEIPYFHKDNFDFYVYGEQHYVYLYAPNISSVGVQSIYTVNGEKRYSAITTYREEHLPDLDSTKVQYNLSLINWRAEYRMLQAGQPVVVKGKVVNTGQYAIPGYTVSCTCNGVRQEETISSYIDPNQERSFSFMVVPTETTAVNNVPIVLHLELNEVQDMASFDNDTTLYYSLYEESLPKSAVLLEEFTSERCGWCPYGAAKIEQAIDESQLSDSIIWICHHEGYAVDWLTAPQSTEYCDLYGGNPFAPAMMLDRDVSLSDEDYPVFSIPEPSAVENLLHEALARPCFVQLELGSTFNEGVADIDVDITAISSFAGQSNHPCLTVMVVEDSIKAKKQKTYDSHTITYHHNALREVLTQTWGDTLTTFAQQNRHFTYQVPADYNVQHLKVVAFVSDASQDVNSRTIFNAAICNLAPSGAGIETVAIASTDVPLFNLQGQRIATPTGLYLQGGKIYYCR